MYLKTLNQHQNVENTVYVTKSNYRPLLTLRSTGEVWDRRVHGGCHPSPDYHGKQHPALALQRCSDNYQQIVGCIWLLFSRNLHSLSLSLSLSLLTFPFLYSTPSKSFNSISIILIMFFILFSETTTTQSYYLFYSVDTGKHIPTRYTCPNVSMATSNPLNSIVLTWENTYPLDLS